MSNDKVPATFHPGDPINLDEPLSEEDAELYGGAFVTPTQHFDPDHAPHPHVHLDEQ